MQFAIIDTRDGRVWFPPDIVNVSTVYVGETPDEPEPDFGALRYRIDSRMLIIIGTQNEDRAREGIGYYEWTGHELKRIRWLQSDKTRCANY